MIETATRMLWQSCTATIKALGEALNNVAESNKDKAA